MVPVRRTAARGTAKRRSKANFEYMFQARIIVLECASELIDGCASNTCHGRSVMFCLFIGNSTFAGLEAERRFWRRRFVKLIICCSLNLLRFMRTTDCDLPPTEWSKIYVFLDLEGNEECYSRNTRRRKLSVCCEKRKLCWRRAAPNGHSINEGMMSTFARPRMHQRVLGSLLGSLLGSDFLQ